MSPVKTNSSKPYYSHSWKSDGIVLSDNDGLVLSTLSVRNWESLWHSFPWVSPDFIVSTEVSLSSGILSSELGSDIHGAISGTVDLWALRDLDVATLLDCDGLWVLAVSEGDVKRLLDSGPWVSENIVFGLNDLDATIVEFSDLLSDISGAIGSSENLNETGADLFDGRLLELDTLNWSEKEGDGSSNKKFHIFKRI